MEPLICTTPDCTSLCSSLRQGGIAALDTEFVWMRTYYPQLGLIQLGSAPGEAWAIDPLSDTSPEPLGELLEDPNTVKILHDAQQDLEHLVHYTHHTPKNVFDTRLAAGFAGFSSILSLKRLLEETLGVTLPKTETLTDWCQRPLTDKQVEYALDDVHYLPDLRADLLRRAEALGTSEYLAEELLRFDAPENYTESNPHHAWIHVKGVNTLRPFERATLKEIATTRELLAREWNIPRTWIAADESLILIARHPSFDPNRIYFKNRIRNRAQRDTIAERFVADIRKAAAVLEIDCPDPTYVPLSPALRAAADRALEFLRERAEELHIDAPVLASRATLTKFLANPEEPKIPLRYGWRYRLVGRDILDRFVERTLF